MGYVKCRDNNQNCSLRRLVSYTVENQFEERKTEDTETCREAVPSWPRLEWWQIIRA